MHSCLYVGQVRHRRRKPVPHEFRYRLFMVYLDLDELPYVFRGRWMWSTKRPNVAWLKRSDHLGDARIPLSTAVRDFVARHTGRPPQGPIRLLTHLRYFGHGFNPVSFYYCFDRAGERVETIVAEVNNTPWGEQHCYVLSADQDLRRQVQRFQLRKEFHVSPFMPMQIDYDWRFSTPKEGLSVHMASGKGESAIFDATLRLRRRDMSSASLMLVLVQYPLMTIRVIGAIYYQALKLWFKGVPVHTHPDKSNSRPRPKELCHESDPRH
ncbi:MAG: DUF1365 domain-containing protein [Gammaproteobacteria bacterium]|nr:DUF1365 domain-containing protein [Gammaproteobacteria bacterium]